MRTKKSKIHEMIPAEIRALVTDCSILSSENAEDYENLFNCLAEMYEPKNTIQWFAVKKLCHLLWEDHRVNRIKAAIIETAHVAKEAREKEGFLVNQIKGLAADWPEKYDKKSVQQAIKDAKVPQRVIEAEAFVERLDALLTVEKMQMANEARQEMVCRQFEEAKIITQLPEETKDNKNSTHGEEDNSAKDEAA
jgi:plasmid rolling circle replication initiator protein Rep